MSDCTLCPVESECAYEYKPCDCVNQRKFKQSIEIKNLPDDHAEVLYKNIEQLYD